MQKPVICRQNYRYTGQLHKRDCNLLLLTLHFDEENLIPVLRYFQKLRILQRNAVSGSFVQKYHFKSVSCQIRSESKSFFSQRSPNWAPGLLRTQCIRGFNFQFLNFQLFLETDLPLNMAIACYFSFLLPHSSKVQARDKVLCCIYLFLLAFRRQTGVTRTIFVFA